MLVAVQTTATQLDKTSGKYLDSTLGMTGKNDFF
jgi:hypothetical protein